MVESPEWWCDNGGCTQSGWGIYSIQLYIDKGCTAGFARVSHSQLSLDRNSPATLLKGWESGLCAPGWRTRELYCYVFPLPHLSGNTAVFCPSNLLSPTPLSITLHLGICKTVARCKNPCLASCKFAQGPRVCSSGSGSKTAQCYPNPKKINLLLFWCFFPVYN